MPGLPSRSHSNDLGWMQREAAGEDYGKHITARYDTILRYTYISNHTHQFTLPHPHPPTAVRHPKSKTASAVFPDLQPSFFEFLDGGFCVGLVLSRRIHITNPRFLGPKW